MKCLEQTHLNKLKSDRHLTVEVGSHRLNRIVWGIGNVLKVGCDGCKIL